MTTALVDAFATALAAALAEVDRRSLTSAHCGDLLVIAADIALLRSSLTALDDAAGVKAAWDAGEAWRTQLLSQAAMGAAADWLERRNQVGRDVFVRGAADGAAGKAPRTMDVTALLRTCLAAIRLPADAGSLYRLPVPPRWSVGGCCCPHSGFAAGCGEAGAALGTFLPELPAALPDLERWCRSAVANTFLTGLELTRDGTITVQQENVWAPINVRVGQGPTSGEIADRAC